MKSHSFLQSLCLSVLVLQLPPAFAAQTISSDPEAVALVREVLALTPQKAEVLDGALQIRRNGYQEIHLKWSIELGIGSWSNIYETTATPKLPAERLIIVHRPGASNEYLLSKTFTATNSAAAAKKLNGWQAAIPFAGTDFWLADFGLEFLHWPLQRMVRDAKITMRSGRPCKVIESTNPNPREGGYGRVVSWIDSEYGGIIYAQAYTPSDKPHKTFQLDGVGKDANGQTRLKGMIIYDYLLDSQTKVEFNFDLPAPAAP